MRSYAVISVLLLSIFGAVPAMSETMIGRWCQKPIRNDPQYDHVISFVITDAGKPVMRTIFLDGSASESSLHELTGEIYQKVGNRFGEKYRIVPSTGNLQLLNKNGLIRIAIRLKNKAQVGECTR